MTLITFTHANSKRPVGVVREQIFSWFYLEAHKSMCLMASGGGLIPVSESMEEVERKLKESRGVVENAGTK